MSHLHAVVWLDHQNARVIDFSVDDVHKSTIEQHGGHRQVHHRAGTVGAGHAAGSHRFFDDVVAAIGDAKEVLIVGPGQAKGELQRYLGERHAQLARRVIAVETLDHPGDGELLAYARRFFRKADAMRGSPGIGQ